MYRTILENHISTINKTHTVDAASGIIGFFGKCMNGARHKMSLFSMPIICSWYCCFFLVERVSKTSLIGYRSFCICSSILEVHAPLLSLPWNLRYWQLYNSWYRLRLVQVLICFSIQATRLLILMSTVTRMESITHGCLQTRWRNVILHTPHIHINQS